MANDKNEEDVKDVDVEETEETVEPTDTEDENDTQSPSSGDENEEEEPEETPEEEETPESEEEPQEPVEDTKKVEGETLRERALRMELENTRKKLRQQNQDDLFVPTKPSVKAEDDILSEYDQEEVAKLEKIIGKLGYVKSSDLHKQTYESTANDELSTFLNSHPEYLAENDKDGTLWNAFRSEFGLYKQPESPKEYKKIFERIHSNLKSSSTFDIKKVNASKEKLKVASHVGAATIGKTPNRQKQNTSGIRDDMLKGFTDEEKAELLS
jgi:hypothetical protein